MEPGTSLRDLLREAGARGAQLAEKEGHGFEAALQGFLGDSPTGSWRATSRTALIRHAKNRYLDRLRRIGGIHRVLPSIRYKGEGLLLELHRRQQSAILLFAHHGPIGAITLGLSGLGLPVLALRNVTSNPATRAPLPGIDLLEMREGSSEVLVFPKLAADRMKRGSFLLLGVDGRLGESLVRLPCLGRLLPFARGAALMHRVTKAPVIPLSVAWAKDDDFIDFRVHPPLVGNPLDPEAGAQAEMDLLPGMARWLEDLVRSDPSQIRPPRFLKWGEEPMAPGPGQGLEAAPGDAESDCPGRFVSDAPLLRVHRTQVGGFQGTRKP